MKVSNLRSSRYERDEIDQTSLIRCKLAAVGYMCPNLCYRVPPYPIISTPRRSRTPNLPLWRRLLCRLSYGRMVPGLITRSLVFPRWGPRCYPALICGRTTRPAHIGKPHYTPPVGQFATGYMPYPISLKYFCQSRSVFGLDSLLGISAETDTRNLRWL